MKRTILYVILIVVVIAAIVGAILWRSQADGQTEGETRSAMVERGTLLVAVSASGSVDLEERVSLAFEVPGQIAQVEVDVGDSVEAGDVLASLDTERLALQVRQAEAALMSAEAQLAKLRAGPRPEEIAAAEANLRAVEAQVSGAAAERDRLASGASDAQIAAVEADLASAITQQKFAEDMHDMSIKCVTFEMPPAGEEMKICPGLGVFEEQARYSLEAADKALTAARAGLDEIQAGADADHLRAMQANVSAAAAQRDAAQAQLDLLLSGATEAQIGAAEAGIAQARAGLEQAELALDQAALRAPFDGIVAEVNVTAGEMSSGGLPAITLVDASEFHLIVKVDEMDVGRLSEGQAAQVTLDALPDVVIDGRVERVAPAATIEGGVIYYLVTIELSPTDAPVRADMTANATIIVEEFADVLTIPTWVVRVDGDTGQTYVDRRGGQQTERVDVELGVRHGGVVQVLDGLAEGDVAVWVQGSMFGFGSP
jgi:HlyD family secretion protein